MKNLLRALALPIALLISCKDQPPAPVAEPKPDVSPENLLPLQVSLEGLGRLSSIASRIEVAPDEVRVEILGEGQQVHLSKFRLDLDRFGTAVASLNAGDFQGTAEAPPPEEGVTYILTSPLGICTVSVDSANPVAPLADSAVRLEPLLELINEWNQIAGNEWKEALIKKATRERKIVQPILNFIEKGMTREKILAKFPEPDGNLPDQLWYKNWDPSLIQNAARKGIYGVDIRFENGVVVSWAVSSAG